MTCDKINDDLSAYLDGELPADARAAVESHLAACGACKALADELKILAGAVAELPRYSAPAGLAQAVHARVQTSAPPLSLIGGAPTGAPPAEFQQRSVWGPVAFGIAAVLMLFALAFAVMPALSNSANPTAMRDAERRRMEVAVDKDGGEALQRNRAEEVADNKAAVLQLKNLETPKNDLRFKTEEEAIGALREDSARPAAGKERQNSLAAAATPADGMEAGENQKMKRQSSAADAREAEPMRKATADGKPHAPFADPGKPAATAAPSAPAAPPAPAPTAAMDRVALQGGAKGAARDGDVADEKEFTRTGGSRRAAPKPAATATTGAPVTPPAPVTETAPRAAAPAPGAAPTAAEKTLAGKANMEKKAAEAAPAEQAGLLRELGTDKAATAVKEREELKKADAHPEANRNANGARVPGEKLEGGFGGAGAPRSRGASAQPQEAPAQQGIRQGGDKGQTRELRKQADAEGKALAQQPQQAPKAAWSFRSRDTQQLTAQIALLATQHGGALEKRGADGALGARIPADQRAAFLKKLQELQGQYAPLEAAKAVENAAKPAAVAAQPKEEKPVVAERTTKQSLKDADEAPADAAIIWIEIISE